jgi:fatty acid desaturase
MNILNILYLFIANTLIISTFIFKIHPLLIILIDLFSLKLLSELIHEGVHYNFTNKKINDLILNLFAFPYFFSGMSEHRKSHYKHHASKNFLVESDPDTSSSIIKVFSLKKLILKLIIDLSGITALKILFQRKSLGKVSRLQTFWNVIYITIIFSISSILENYISIIIFLLVILNLYPIFFRIRNYIQHFDFKKISGYQTKNSNNSTGIIFNLIIASDIMRFHDLHHMYPGYCFRTLRKIYKSNDNYLKNSTSFISILKLINK